MWGRAGGTEGGCTRRFHEQPEQAGAAPSAARLTNLGGSTPLPARPQLADPTSAPHPFLTDSRPRPRDGAENLGISRSPLR